MALNPKSPRSMFTRRSLLKSGMVAATAGSLVVSDGLLEAATQGYSIGTRLAAAGFTPSTGRLVLLHQYHTFAEGIFCAPGASKASISRLPAGNPFGAGTVVHISPGENRIVILDHSPLIFLRRDPRSVTPAMPGNHVDVVKMQLKLRNSAAAQRSACLVPVACWR